MSDNSDDIDLGENENAATEATPRRGAGLSALLPNILKFVAIGVGSLIFIVTVSVVTFRILSGSGESQTVQPATEAYQPKRREYSWFSSVGQIRTRTSDEKPYSVVVKVVIGYTKDNKTTQNELTSRLYEIKDHLLFFFSTRTAAELKPENIDKIKILLVEELNREVLQDSQIQDVRFEQLDVVEM